ncbi:glycosyltransferase family 4 protein [Clostridium sediminicola]|uniref:glycosyltransferase family 4 protein n=1 Tax=Clostridium sediminicola TaxID=3114879 RepID=UPI0031F1D9AF
MKILHITAQKPFQTGSGIYARNIIKEFDEKGYKQAIVSGISKNEKVDVDTKMPLEEYTVYFNSKQVTFPVVGMSDVMPYESTRYRDLDENMLECFIREFRVRIMEAVRKFDPDIIISHHLYLVTALAASIIKDKKIIGVCHGTDLRQIKSINLKKDFIKDNIKKLDAIFALHDEQKNDIKECFDIDEKSIHVMGSGYDNSIFYSNNCSNKRGLIKIIYAGKISYAKGLIPFINAYSSLEIPKNKIKLSLAGMGSGEEYKEIHNISKKSPFDIEFMGNLPQKKLAEEFRKSDIFILPSFYEGLPLVLIEALASGLYVITTDIPGVRQWLGDKINTSGRIKYLSLPRLKKVDVPLEKDLPNFQNSIKKEIEEYINHINNRKYYEEIDLTHLTWNGLSKKMEEVFL